jgi:hypothetical protein
MIGKNKASEIKAEVAALLGKLPGRSPRAWLKSRIDTAAENKSRDVQTLEMLCAALDSQAKKNRKPKTTSSRRSA